MRLLSRVLGPRLEATAHCDLPCGVYDPAQARIEAESVKAVQEKYQGNEDPEFRARAIVIKEQRSELVKHHLWVLWTDYFKAPHFEKYPQLNTLFNEATKLAGAGGTKGSSDVAVADQLIAKIDEIEDLRIAIDEACAMLLAQAIPGTNLECAFDLGVDLMTITVSVTAAEPSLPAKDTFAWTVLSALAGTVDSRLGDDDQVSIVLCKHRETPVSGLGSGASGNSGHPGARSG